MTPLSVRILLVRFTDMILSKQAYLHSLLASPWHFKKDGFAKALHAGFCLYGFQVKVEMITRPQEKAHKNPSTSYIESPKEKKSL